MAAERIKYLDVMRGVTMLLVVYQHIRSYSIGLDGDDSDFASLFLLFRMPMFFFISGYIAYKSVNEWNIAFYGKRLLKKAKVQLIPTIIFFVMFSLYAKHTVNIVSFPGGYWFTLVLFEMFFIYFTLSLICKYLKLYGATEVILIAVAIFSMFMPIPEGNSVHWLCLSQLRGYTRFFVFGILCRKYENYFLSILTKNFYTTLLIVVVTVLLTMNHLGKMELFPYSKLIFEVVLKCGLVCVVFMFFYHYRVYWNGNSIISRSLQFIGHRTLDLYMLHYFFLPDIPQLYDFFAEPGNEVLEFVFLAFITLAITGVSLFVSSVLRCSPFLAKWLFGQSQTVKV